MDAHDGCEGFVSISMLEGESILYRARVTFCGRLASQVGRHEGCAGDGMCVCVCVIADSTLVVIINSCIHRELE